MISEETGNYLLHIILLLNGIFTSTKESQDFEIKYYR